MNSYKPGDRISVRVDNNGNCTDDVFKIAKIVDVIVLAVCGDGMEYLVHADGILNPNAIICAKDWQEPSLRNFYNIHEEINKYDNQSGAWVQPRYIVDRKNKTNRSGEYRLNIQ